MEPSSVEKAIAAPKKATTELVVRKRKVSGKVLNSAGLNTRAKNSS